MRPNLISLLLLAGCAALVACSPAPAAAPTLAATSQPTPNLQATVEAAIQATMLAAPTPTAVPSATAPPTPKPATATPAPPSPTSTLIPTTPTPVTTPTPLETATLTPGEQAVAAVGTLDAETPEQREADRARQQDAAREAESYILQHLVVMPETPPPPGTTVDPGERHSAIMSIARHRVYGRGLMTATHLQILINEADEHMTWDATKTGPAWLVSVSVYGGPLADPVAFEWVVTMQGYQCAASEAAKELTSDIRSC